MAVIYKNYWKKSILYEVNDVIKPESQTGPQQRTTEEPEQHTRKPDTKVTNDDTGKEDCINVTDGTKENIEIQYNKPKNEQESGSETEFEPVPEKSDTESESKRLTEQEEVNKRRR